MQRTTIKTKYILTLIIAGMVASTPALAEKPAHAGGGKPEKHVQKHNKHDQGDNESSRRNDDAGSPSVSVHFGDHQRAVIHDYYDVQFRAGRCPPGLAKKHNGCMPPGQAKKWSRGHVLSRDVIYYDLPPKVVIQLGAPPSGHRYVRVATDILLIAIGTGMVVDAIEDLGRM
jgi:Ni/Co efflux regulator RcnB